MIDRERRAASMPSAARGRRTPAIWKAGMADHMFVLRRRPAPIRHVMLLLGLLAVIAGVLGMHTLSVFHQAAPEHAAASGHGPSHNAGASPGAGGSRTAPGTPHAGGSSHTIQGVTDSAAALTTAGPDLHSATCAGPCGGEHTMATACVFLVVLTGLLLAFLLRRLHESGSHGLRAPPPSPTWIRAIPRPPSLLELSVSRT
jgi:hypothetical protein